MNTPVAIYKIAAAKKARVWTSESKAKLALSKTKVSA
jgi:hypothetical protein